MSCGIQMVSDIIIGMGGDLEPSLGGVRKNIFAEFSNDLYLGKNSYFNAENF